MGTEFSVFTIHSGWELSLGDIVLQAEGAVRDRGVVRCTLSAYRDDSLIYRDALTLSGERSRRRYLARLNERGAGVPEEALLALDEAIRQSPRPSTNVRQPHDTPTGIPDKVLDIAGLQAAFARWLLIEDADYLPVLTGAVLAHRLGSDPVWLQIVAPPGATKSEPLRSLYGYPGIYPLSDLSAKTLASGLDVGDGSDASLLARLTNEILVLKDFTTVLQKSREERQAILGQLREVYDGQFDRVWGTGRELHWRGRLGFIAGVTPVIDCQHSVLAVLGERFVLFRLRTLDRVQMALAALRDTGREAEMRRKLNAAMCNFLRGRRSEPPAVSESTLATIAAVADLVTRARSGVVRDGFKRELEYAPEAEAPTRFAKVLLNLARGIALAHDSPDVTDRELRIVLRVALDSLPVIRQRVIAALVQGAIVGDASDGLLSTSRIANAAQFSTSAIRRALEDLQALGVVTCHKGGSGVADRWELGAEWGDKFRALAAAADNVVRHPLRHFG